MVIALTGYQDSKNIELKYICFDRYIKLIKMTDGIVSFKTDTDLVTVYQSIVLIGNDFRERY